MANLVTKITLITVNLNNCKGLETTIKSVISQTYKNTEYIIIDGASIDGSVNMIKNYEKSINYWVSESDYGIYFAMNKAIKKATGDYLLFINSGDYLIDSGIIEKCVIELENKDFVYGDLYVTDRLKTHLIRHPNNLTFKDFYNKSIPHSGGTFIKKKIFDKYGFYDEELKIVSDWKFFITTIVLNNCSKKHLPFPISYFSLDGISTKETNLMHNERKTVLNKYFPELVLKDYELDASNIKDYNKDEVYFRISKYKLSSFFLSLIYHLTRFYEKIFFKKI